jgi:hypothetical protein
MVLVLFHACAEGLELFADNYEATEDLPLVRV